MVFFIFLYCKVALYCDLGFWKSVFVTSLAREKTQAKFCAGGGGECVITGDYFSHFLMRF